ncbi:MULTISPECIES: hypothetical protein [unclassified Paenibacillus]|uniref:hypothetical protein n=1 Tax=unclassified Paenibacillus TaxID=185978 RepID=UPI0009A80ADD|nr:MULTISPECIES: hypothetical protein [unclassified Paenibacillus]SLK17350.1 hypothetical protein SAMN06272722_11173 [Paenibacillus sp. RU5A]SOC74722.1 hypothetical protein SAMN05880581_11173 [Paenibacillus sp. RU26A]SOC76861.1 hypothetical protein SAMN05880586_11173 [Paenibacillus sp. RU5M]
MNITQRKLLALLESTFNSEDDIHFLAIAEKEIQINEKELPVHQERVALTFKEGGTVNPYYNGTDLFVTIGEDNIQFALEKDWVEEPPTIEGSPTEFALGWVSELAEPFYVSREALTAAKSSNYPRYNNNLEGNSPQEESEK